MTYRKPRDGKCLWTKCSAKSDIGIGYYSVTFELCDKHWDKWCDLAEEQQTKLVHQWLGPNITRDHGPFSSPYFQGEFDRLPKKKKEKECPLPPTLPKKQPSLSTSATAKRKAKHI